MASKALLLRSEEGGCPVRHYPGGHLRTRVEPEFVQIVLNVIDRRPFCYHHGHGELPVR
jgi:hypothetical protein